MDILQDVFQSLPTAIQFAKARAAYFGCKLWIAIQGEQYEIHGTLPRRGSLAATVWPGGRCVIGMGEMAKRKSKIKASK